MNKKLLFVIIALIVVLGGIGYLFYIQSLHTVTININKSINAQIGIYKTSNTHTAVASLSKTGAVRLQSGDYEAMPAAGSSYDTTPVTFTVNSSDLVVTVDPGFSVDYLNNQLTKELPDIKKVLTNTYPVLTSNFTIDIGHLYKEGQWYATTLPQNPTPDNQGDVYRTVLEKVNGVWKIKAAPAIILTASDNKDIPVDILRDINSR